MTVDAFTMYEEKSFWARDYGPYTPNPALRESVKVDVAIIGGGFLGLNTAREFKSDNPNARVVVIEGFAVGHGASGRNAGFNMTLFGMNPQATKLRWGKQRTVEAYDYMVDAVDYTKRIIESNNLDSDYSHPGLLKVAYTQAQVKTLRGDLNAFEDLGLADKMRMRWVNKEELREQFQSPLLSAGIVEPHMGLVNPTKHVRELKRLAEEAGVEVYEQTPATRIDRQGSGVVITTPGGTIRSNKVVLATNAYTHLLEGLKKTRNLQFPMWTSVIVTERLTDEQWASIGWEERQGMEDARGITHYYRPTPDGRILIGGRDTHTCWDMFKNLDHDYNPKVWRALESQLKRIFPSLRDVRIAYRWSGAISVNADVTPEIGFIGDERIIYSTGCIGHGVSMTHLNGRLIADLLNGNRTKLTDFWIVDRSAIRLPGKVITFLGTKIVRNLLVMTDRVLERHMPDD